MCDPDPGRLDEVRAKYPEVRTTSSATEVFADSEVKGVVVATPASTHADIGARALEAGKDVLIEKPMALTAEDGERLLELSKSNDRLLAVGHVLEYHPAVRKLKELIVAGELGRVRYLYSNRLNHGRIRTEENALWSFAPHDIAIMLRFLGSLPEEVSCTGGAYLNRNVPDITHTSLRFPGEVRGHIFVSWLHPFKEHRFVVLGDEQMAVFDDTQPWSNKLLLYPHKVDWLEGQIPVARKAEAVAIDLTETEPLKLECLDFVQCLETRAQPLVDASSGLDVLRVLETAQRSLDRHGESQHIAPTDKPSLHLHPTASVDEGAEIGDGTYVWHFSHVMKGATVGRNCSLGQNVFVGPRVRIGDGVKIQNNVSLYEGVEVEDHVFCGPSVVFTNVINPRSEIERKNEFKNTLVKRGATLGANSTLVCGVTVGRYAFVAAGAVVTRDVPDHAVVIGNPGRVKGWMCECGVKLELAEGKASCLNCGKAYRSDSQDRVVRA